MNILVVKARCHAQVADAPADGATGALDKGGDAARAGLALIAFEGRLEMLS